MVHHGGYYEDDVVDRAGLRVLCSERVAAELPCSSLPQDGIVVADEVLRRAGEHHELASAQILSRITRRADPRGTVRTRNVLDLASPRAESAQESRLRMILIQRGFPLPEVDFWVQDVTGRRVCRVDLAWPDVRIAVEYDGYEAHVGRGAADAARAEDLHSRGWIVIRVDKHDMRDLGRVVRELDEAFAERGYSWVRREMAGDAPDQGSHAVFAAHGEDLTRPNAGLAAQNAQLTRPSAKPPHRTRDSPGGVQDSRSALSRRGGCADRGRSRPAPPRPRPRRRGC